MFTNVSDISDLETRLNDEKKKFEKILQEIDSEIKYFEEMKNTEVLKTYRETKGSVYQTYVNIKHALVKIEAARNTANRSLNEALNVYESAFKMIHKVSNPEEEISLKGIFKR